MSVRISYKHFCLLGGLTHPETWTRVITTRHGGKYWYTEYYLRTG